LSDHPPSTIEAPTDPDTLRAINPYTVYPAPVTLDEVKRAVNRLQHRMYSSDSVYTSDSIGKGRLKRLGTVASSLFDYKRFLDALNASGKVEFVTHHDLLVEKRKTGKIRVAIRHDIDTDIVGALAMAEIEHQANAPTTWYVLHNAYYYRTMTDTGFARHECLAHWYKRFQDLGHEVAFHTDGLRVYQWFKMDGAQSIKDEIEWLRSLGITITGTAAHGMKDRLGGAWNYQIFKGYKKMIEGHLDPSEGPTEVFYTGPHRDLPPVRPADRRAGPAICKDAWSPLEVLDPEELGLRYEANEIWLPDQFPEGLIVYSVDAADSWWSTRWTIPINMGQGPREQPMLDEQQVIDEILTLPPNAVAVIQSHPCYHGHRHARDKGPALRLNTLPTSHHPELGWTTWTPSQLVAYSAPDHKPQRFQTFHTPNRLGMLDLTWTDSADSKDNRGDPITVDRSKSAPEDLHTVFLGADNTDALTCSKAAQIHRRMVDLFDKHAQRAIHPIKLAHPSMGLDRLFAWYEHVHDRVEPDLVVIGIGDQSILLNDPQWWSRETGFSPTYPAGPYLRANDDHSFTTVRTHPSWALRRSDPKPSDPLDRPTDPNDPRWDHVQRLYTHAIRAIQSKGAKVVLLVESKGEGNGFHHTKRTDPARAQWMTDTTQRLQSIADTIGVPLIDPYPELDELSETLRAHFDTDHRWGPMGHRIAARTLFEHLEPAPQPEE